MLEFTSVVKHVLTDRVVGSFCNREKTSLETETVGPLWMLKGKGGLEMTVF